MKKYIIIVISALFPLLTMGQYTSTFERPTWVDGFFEDCTNSYVEVVSGTGNTKEQARKAATQRIIEQRGLATSVQSKIHIENGDITTEGNNELAVKSRIISEYYEELPSGGYKVSLLTQTAKNPYVTMLEPVEYTNKYPFSARVFIPGMAQIHKGSITKGALFIAGEVAAIGGIVICESMKASYKSKINSTHNNSLRNQYIDNADLMENMSYGFIAGAAVIYVWNVIDGIVANGKKHVEVGSVNMTFTPYAYTESAGLAVKINF